MLIRIAALIAIGLVAAACDSGTVSPTTSPPGVPTTTTSIVGDTCGRLAEDTATYLETLIDVLDEVTLDQARDPDAWPEALIALEQQGHDLDARAAEMRCDPGQVQIAAFLAADLDPDSDLARYLLTLMGR